MQDGKADSLYKKYCGDIEKDRRLRRDLKRHNWLLRKLNKRLINSDRSRTKAVKMKQSLPLQKAKIVPKLRATLPVSLPLPYNNKFLRNTMSQENSVLKKYTEKKSLTSLVKKKSILGASNIISQEHKNDDSKHQYHVNNTELITKNESTDTMDLAAKAPPQSLNVIHINFDFDKYKRPVPVKEVSVQVPENVSHEIKNKLPIYDIDVTTIPLPLQDKCTITDCVTVIYGDDVELFRTVKHFNFTLEDLEKFNQITIENNNNQAEFENQNEIIELDIIDSEDSVSENDGNVSVENTSNSNKQTINNNTLSNLNNKQIVKRHHQSSSLATELFERLKLWSDLNKVILRTFYEGILLEKDKGHDKEGMENYLSLLSQNLVDQICDMVTNYSEANGKQISRVIEITDSDDCDDNDTLVGKTTCQTDKGTTGQINGTNKIRTDAQQHQEYAVQNNNVSPNLVTQNQDTILESPNLVILHQGSNQENEVEATLNQITQNQENRQETQHQVTQSPIRTQILQNQLLPAQSLQNIFAPIDKLRRMQNQMQNISPVYQETAYTEAVPQKPTVLREFRMNSMPDLPVYRSSKNYSRSPDYYISRSDQPASIENTLHPPHIQNVRKQQNSRNRHDQTYSRQWYRTPRFQEFHQNQTPIDANYPTGNRTFQNVIQQNSQYNSPANYHNLYPYNFRNSYSGDYRRW